MAKTLVAKNIESIGALQFQTDQGVITGASLTVNVNYGELGLVHQIDIWSLLQQPPKDRLQAIYDGLVQLANRQFLGA